MSALNEPALIPYRVSQLETRAEHLESGLKEKADVTDLGDLIAEVQGLRRTLTAFIVAIASSSVVFALTVVGAHFQ